MAPGDLLKKLNSDLAEKRKQIEAREAEQSSLNRANERVNPRGLTTAEAVKEGAVKGSDRWGGDPESF